MSAQARDGRAAVGFTVKSGWTSVVIVGGTAAAPMVLESLRLDLSDPAVPDSRQPYHAGFGTAREAGPELSRLIAFVERFGRRSIATFFKQADAAGHRLGGAGIIVGSTNDPARIANDHIRIHALEGQLFRRIVEAASAERGLASHVWRERDVYATASTVLKQPEQRLRTTVAALGKSIDGPWRAEQKAAALAAWLVLAGPPRAAGRV